MNTCAPTLQREGSERRGAIAFAGVGSDAARDEQMNIELAGSHVARAVDPDGQGHDSPKPPRAYARMPATPSESLKRRSIRIFGAHGPQPLHMADNADAALLHVPGARRRALADIAPGPGQTSVSAICSA